MRGEAIRRSHDHGLPPFPQGGHQDRAHFQHLWPAHEAGGRARGAGLYRPGVEQGKSLTVFGDGSQTRSFCYVCDLIEGIFRLSLSDHHGPVNIGNPGEMTIKQFAEKILQITEAKSAIEYRELPVDDPKVRQPDITRARTQLNNWGPRVEFDEGIRVTIDYFRKN